MEKLNLRNRIPELDGFRGLGILMVLFFHYYQSAPLPRYISALGQMTWSALDSFFVLSGFLIGGILLENRTSPNYFKTFYVRRAYRILPLYIVIVAVFWILISFINFENQNETFRWLFFDPAPWYSFATFTQNFAMAQRGTFGPGGLGVTWSVAVEEQFYLTLPLMIWYLSPRRLPYVLAAFFIAAPTIRFILHVFYSHGDIAGYILMPCRADALMLGVGAALLMRSERARQFLADNKKLLYGILLLLTCGMIWMGLKAAGLRHEYKVPDTETSAGSGLLASNSSWIVFQIYARKAISSLNHTWIDFFYLCLLLIAITHRSSLLSRLLRNRLLLGAGKISYATYYFHQPVQGLFYGFIRGYLPQVRNLADAGIATLSLAVTLGLACLSWWYFEKPFLRRGYRYQYRDHASQRTLGMKLEPIVAVTDKKG